MINCEKVWILEENFVKSYIEKTQTEEIPVHVESEYAPNKDETIKNAKLEMYMEVGEKDSTEYPFYFKIKLAGIFGWDEESKEEAENKILTEGREILYSFIRTYFYEMLNRADMNAVVLPTLED